MAPGKQGHENADTYELNRFILQDSLSNAERELDLAGENFDRADARYDAAYSSYRSLPHEYDAFLVGDRIKEYLETPVSGHD